MSIKKIALLIFSAVIVSGQTFARCREFEEQPPTFCATVKILDRTTATDGTCYAWISPSRISDPVPVFASFPQTLETLAKAERVLVRLEKSDCQRLENISLDRGVLEKICNDNHNVTLLPQFVLRWLGHGEAEYLYGKTQILKSGAHKGQVIACEPANGL